MDDDCRNRRDCVDDGFPGEPVKDLVPIRFGQAIVKVYKKTTIYRRGSVDTQTEKLCEGQLPFAVFDARGEDSYAISPPEGTYFRCDIEYRRRRGEFVVVPTALLNDELPFIGDPDAGRVSVDNKTLEAAAFFHGRRLLSDIYSKAIPFYSVTSKDLQMRNAMFGQSFWSDANICWENPEDPENPERPGPRSNSRGDGDRDDSVFPPNCPRSGQVVEDFYFEVEMNDDEA